MRIRNYFSHFLTAILMLAVNCTTRAQNGLPEVNGPKSKPDLEVAGNSDSKVYEDRDDGFQFKYPSSLHLDPLSLTFRDLGKSGFINLRIILSDDPKPYLNPGKDVPTPAATEVFNHVTWTKYSWLGGARYCTYWTHELVCLDGTAHGPQGTQLSPTLLSAMREMQTTFVFADVSDRTDFRIAALKVGARFGSLRVGRVITRKMAEGNRKDYWENPHGEVDFIGSLRLTGFIENNQTMNSGPNLTMSLDAESCSRLPQVGVPRDFSKAQGFQIHFSNPGFVFHELQNYSDETKVTVVVDRIAAIYYPGGGPPSVEAELVKLMPETH